MARSDGVERVAGIPPQSIEAFVTAAGTSTLVGRGGMAPGVPASELSPGFTNRFVNALRVLRERVFDPGHVRALLCSLIEGEVLVDSDQPEALTAGSLEIEVRIG